MKFYIGYHDGDVGKRPTVQNEFVIDVDMDIRKSSKLLRALKEIFNYLTTGDSNE